MRRFIIICLLRSKMPKRKQKTGNIRKQTQKSHKVISDLRDFCCFIFQLLLQRMLEKVDFLKNNASTGLLGAEAAKLPGEAMRMAMCVLTVAPMLLVFPRFQKYFVKGMAIGSVKE